MSDDPAEQPRYPVVYTAGPRNEWSAALIAACLAIGFAMAWGTFELRQRVAREDEVARFRRAVDVLASDQSDLGWLLANPRTQLIPLIPVENSPLRAASVAWNSDMQRGAIFCSDLAAQGRRRYQISLAPATGVATVVVIGPTEPGKTIYPLNPTPGRMAILPTEIVLNSFNESGDEDHGEAELARGKVRQED